MTIDIPTAGSPILDTWGEDVANQLNRIIPLSLTANQSTDTAVPLQVITDLSFPMVSGKSYNGSIHGEYSASATNQGPQFDIVGPGGSGTMSLIIWGDTGPTDEERYRASLSTPKGNTVTDIAATRRAFWVYFYYLATSTGDFTIRFGRGGTSGGTGITLYEGAGGIVTASS